MSKATYWQNLAKLDLKSTQKYLQQDSIGGADKRHPQFTQWLNQGYKKSLHKVAQVNSASSYDLLLHFYLNQFHDEHIEYVPYLKRFNFPSQWPEFTIYFADGHYRVSTIARLYDKNLPPARAELISCDGQHIDTLMLQRVFPYFGNPKLNADWHINTPRLFFYAPNPWFALLKSCLFKTAKSKKIYTLHWREVSAQRARQLRHEAGYGQISSTGSHEFAQNSIWVNLPSFMPRNEKKIQALTTVLQKAKTWQKENTIVFDTRGNLGGLSLWGSQLLQNLYGKPYCFQQTY